MSGVEGVSGGSFFSPDIRITMPGYVREIIDRLTSRGFSAYAVGGAVRDCVLGLSPDDWDVASSALPEEIESAFSDYRNGNKTRHGERCRGRQRRRDNHVQKRERLFR